MKRIQLLAVLISLFSVLAGNTKASALESNETVVMRITAETQTMRCSTLHLYAQPGTVITFNKERGLNVVRGRVIVRASEPLKVKAGGTELTADENRIIAVENFKDKTRIYAMSDSVVVKTEKGEKSIDCGRELLVFNNGEAHCVIAKFPMFAFLKQHPCARLMRTDDSAKAKEMMEELIKTCAAFECMKQAG